MEETKKKKKFIWRWLLIIFFLLTGVLLIFSDFGTGIVWILIAVILLPQLSEFIMKKWNFVFSTKFQVLAIVILILLSITVFPNINTPTAPTPQKDNTIKLETDQQKLENNLTNDILQSSGSSNFGYKDIQIEKVDSDRPAGTKMITVMVDVKGFYNKSSLLKDTGKLSSKLFQTVFASNMNAYDIIIWYYAKTTDVYGNEKDGIILSYAIDKATFGKINWDNFDQTKLCDFLREEDQRTGNNFNTVCRILVNIQ